MSEKHAWYSLSNIQQADMIGHISWNLTIVDDHNIELSNIARDVLDSYGIDTQVLASALDDIEIKWRMRK